jgi:hypothetical protein
MADSAEKWPDPIPDYWGDEMASSLAWEYSDWEIRGTSGTVDDCHIVEVGAQIEGAPVSFIALADLSWPKLQPVRLVADSKWHSESGGAPISWDGGNAVELLNGRIAMKTQWGDYGDERELVILSNQEHELAEFLSSWIEENSLAVPAALYFEPLDPRGVLTEQQREKWRELIVAVDIWLVLDVPDSLLTLVRNQLMKQSGAYAQVAHAKATPRGKDARVLRDTLESVNSDGVLGPLLELGEWSDWSQVGS